MKQQNADNTILCLSSGLGAEHELYISSSNSCVAEGKGGKEKIKRNSIFFAKETIGAVKPTPSAEIERV